MSAKVKVVFFLSSDNLDPGIITDLTKIEPTSWWRKGDPVATRTGLIRKEGRWEISTGFQESLDVGVQLNLIYEMIADRKQHLSVLIETHKLYVKFDIVIKVTTDTPSFFLGRTSWIWYTTLVRLLKWTYIQG